MLHAEGFFAGSSKSPPTGKLQSTDRNGQRQGGEVFSTSNSSYIRQSRFQLKLQLQLKLPVHNVQAGVSVSVLTDQLPRGVQMYLFIFSFSWAPKMRTSRAPTPLPSHPHPPPWLPTRSHPSTEEIFISTVCVMQRPAPHVFMNG